MPPPEAGFAANTRSSMPCSEPIIRTRPLGSAVEHSLHTRGVSSSNLLAGTNLFRPSMLSATDEQPCRPSKDNLAAPAKKRPGALCASGLSVIDLVGLSRLLRFPVPIAVALIAIAWRRVILGFFNHFRSFLRGTIIVVPLLRERACG